MTGPEQTAARFAAACLLGVLLGLLYGFLRPLRPKRTTIADILFVTGAACAWVYLGFAVCRGDLRLGYTAGLAVGALAWELTLGRLLRPVFFGFWTAVGRCFRFFFLPLVKFLKKILRFIKFLLASFKKWVTIKWNNRPQRREPGGTTHGRKHKAFHRSEAGLSPQPHPDQDRGAGGRRIVYGGTSDTARRHSDH